MYWFLHIWHSCIFSPDIASFSGSFVCLIAIVIAPPFLPNILSIGKNGHKGIFDSNEHSDIVSNCKLVSGLADLFVEYSHMDDCVDDPIPCLAIANGLFAKSLIISFTHHGELIFKKIYRHKITSFMFIIVLGWV
jgi:hypothetical protein